MNFMKQNIKFILSLGNSKLIMLDGVQGPAFYSRVEDGRPTLNRANLKRIASILSETK
jgi:hypothetical protein